MTNQGKDIGVAIVEDNRFLREAWKTALSDVPGFRVTGDFGSFENALSSGAFDETTVVLMDIGLPGLSGIEGIRKLRSSHPAIAAIVCTVYEDDRVIFDALCAGAVGYLLKGIAASDIVHAIHLATEGGSPMSPAIARRVISFFQEPLPGQAGEGDKLTERELETLNHLATGKSYAEIAESSFITIDAVRSRIRSIYVKMQVHSRGEAVAKGLAKRIIRRI